MNHPNWLLYLLLSSIDTSKVAFFTRNAQVGARFIAPYLSRPMGIHFTPQTRLVRRDKVQCADDLATRECALPPRRASCVGTRCGEGRMRGPCACPRPVGLPTYEHPEYHGNRITHHGTSTKPPPLRSTTPCPYIKPNNCSLTLTYVHASLLYHSLGSPL